MSFERSALVGELLLGVTASCVGLRLQAARLGRLLGVLDDGRCLRGSGFVGAAAFLGRRSLLLRDPRLLRGGLGLLAIGTSLGLTSFRLLLRLEGAAFLLERAFPCGELRPMVQLVGTAFEALGVLGRLCLLDVKVALSRQAVVAGHAADGLLGRAGESVDDW